MKARMFTILLIIIAFITSELVAQEKPKLPEETIIAKPYIYDEALVEKLNLARESGDKVTEDELLNQLFNFHPQENNYSKDAPSFIISSETEAENPSWDTDIPVMNSSNHEKSPSIERLVGVAFTPDIMIAAEEWSGTSSPDKIRIKRSSNHGETFTSASATFDSPPPLSKPKISQITSNEIGLVFVLQSQANQNDVYFARVNKDLSSPLSGPISNTGADERRPYICSNYGQGGTTYIFVIYYSVSGSTAYLRFKMSTNNGQTWSSATNIDTFTPPYNFYCSMDFDNSKLLVTYTVRGSSSDDIKASYSANFGSNWSSPLTLAGFSNDELYPEVAVLTNLHWVVFYEYWFSSLDRDIYYAYTTNGGSTWQAYQSLTLSLDDERFATVGDGPGSLTDVYAGYVNITEKKVEVFKTTYTNLTNWTYEHTANSTNYFVSDDDPIALLPKYKPTGGSGVGVAWAEMHGSNYDIYFDADWLTGTTPTEYTLTVQSQNPNSGVSIAVSPIDNNEHGNGTTTFTRVYDSEVWVALSALETAGGNPFLKWQKNGVDYTTNRHVSIPITADLTMRAVYGQTNNYSISILPNSQTVSGTIGTLIPLEIKIGDPNAVLPPDNFYGVSFDLNWDNTQYIEYSNQHSAGPWLGPNPLVFIQAFPNHIEAGLSRTVSPGQTGSGIVLLCSLKIKAAPPSGITATLTLSNVTAIQEDGSPLNLSATGPSTVIVTVGVEVWPGDADNNGFVNAADVLRLGLHYNKTGPARPGGSCSWGTYPPGGPQICPLGWVPADAAYADCNGDGTINAADVLCIGLNYGRTHTTTLAGGTESTGSGSTLGKENPNAPLLRYNIYNANNKPTSINNLKSGDNFYLSVSIDNPTDILGISFSVDWKGITGNPVALEVIKDWGTNGIKTAEVWGEKIISLSKTLTYEGRIDIGITKTDGIALKGGNTELVRIKMKVIDEESIDFNFEDIYANDVEGDMLDVSSIAVEKGLSQITETVPEDFLLSNYPNPFNPTTRIQVGIPQQSRISLIIYNSLGQEVIKLVEGVSLDAGIYEYQWDASNVPSGIYFYRLETNSYSTAKKMLLIK